VSLYSTSLWLAYSHHCYKSKVNSSYIVITREQSAEFLQPGSHLSVTEKSVTFVCSSADGQGWSLLVGSVARSMTFAWPPEKIMCCADDIAWLYFNIYNASSQRRNCHPLNFIYKFASSDWPSHPCYTDSNASRGQKAIPGFIFLQIFQAGSLFLQLGLNPGDLSGKPLPCHNFIYCPVSLLAQHFWFIRNIDLGFM